MLNINSAVCDFFSIVCGVGAACRYAQYAFVCRVRGGMQSMCRYAEYVVVWLVCGVFAVQLSTCLYAAEYLLVCIVC